MPEQVTINISKGVPIPKTLPGHQWGKIIHDNTVTWLASWTDSINGDTKYVFLAAGSTLKGQSDFKKFEKARQLKVISLLILILTLLIETCGSYKRNE